MEVSRQPLRVGEDGALPHHGALPTSHPAALPHIAKPPLASPSTGEFAGQLRKPSGPKKSSTTEQQDVHVVSLA